MTTEDMEQRLKSHFNTDLVAVLDTTGGGNHFEVRITSSKLNKLNRVQQHQSIMSVFKDELKSGEVHALTIKVLDT